MRYQLSQTIKLPKNTQIFIISYQDEDLYQHLIQDIKSQTQCTTQQYLSLSNLDSWESLSALTQNYNLFQDPTFYELELEKTGLNIKKLPTILPLEGDVFVFKTTQFKHNLFNQLSALPNSLWIQSYAPNINDLWQWVKTKLNHYKLAPNIHSWFINQHAIQFGDCKQLVEKINLSAEHNSTIELTDIENHLGIQQHDDWNPMIEAWMQGQTALAITRLREVLMSQSEFTLLVWLLNRNLQVLFALNQHIQSTQTIFEQYKIWPKQTALFINSKANFTLDKLAKLIQLLKIIDAQVKSGQNQMVSLQLERFLLLSHEHCQS
jgi:hypothetical protein